jgi:hypothetical protein
MRSTILLIAMLATRVASAQPSMTPASASPLTLTADEEQLLDEGLISGDRIAGGVVLSIFVPFGAGQAVEGRWGNTGYLFAIGDAVWVSGLVGIVANHGQSCGGQSTHCNGWDELVPFDILLMLAVKTLEVVDASVGPGKHNRRVRGVRSKLGQPLDDEARVLPFIVPSDRGKGGVAGLSLSF